jgi:hypothetical protein
MNMFKPTTAKTVSDYIAQIDEPRKGEIKKLHAFIRNLIPDEKPHLVYSMIGYGSFHYKYASGREGDWPIIALASQKNYISVYVCAVDDNGKYVAENYKQQLPKSDIGRSCIRFKKLDDINLEVLGDIIQRGISHTPAL